MISGALFTLGLLFIVTPGFMALMAGAQTEDDLIRWLSSQPLQFIIGVRVMMISGVGLLGVGAAFQYLPS